MHTVLNSYPVIQLVYMFIYLCILLCYCDAFLGLKTYNFFLCCISHALLYEFLFAISSTHLHFSHKMPFPGVPLGSLCEFGGKKTEGIEVQ